MPKDTMSYQYQRTPRENTPHKKPSKGSLRSIIILIGIFGTMLISCQGPVEAMKNVQPSTITSIASPTIIKLIKPTNAKTSIPTWTKVPPTPTWTNVPPTPTSTATPTITLQALSNFPCVTLSSEREEAKLIQVTDGDTIVVSMNGVEYKVRYIGVDSTEQGANYYQQAADYNKNLLGAGTLVMIKDVSETDKYDRLLRYVFANGKFVNYEMAKSGYAKSGSWPPDTSCDSTFSNAMASAKSNQSGMWFIPVVIVPPTSRPPLGIIATTAPAAGSSCPSGCTQSSPNCLIKGNISSGGKIYHMPGQTYYNKTVISPEKGERWFCTEAEAVANGWRKALK